MADIRRRDVNSEPRRVARLPVHMTEEEINQSFASCLPRLNRYARKMLDTPQDCEDAVQEALLLAFRKLHQFEGRSSFTTWLHSIVRNTSRRYYRNSAAHPCISMDQHSDSEGHSPSVDDLPDTQPNPEEKYMTRERSQILERVTDKLPARYHEPIYLFYIKGLGEEATAKALGMSVSALKAQLHRSRMLLTWRMRKICLPAARIKLLYLRRPTSLREWPAKRVSNGSCKRR